MSERETDREDIAVVLRKESRAAEEKLTDEIISSLEPKDSFGDI